MSVLIKGMEMPKDCISCEFSYPMFEGIWYCGYTGKYIDEENDEEYYEAAYSYDCPLVEVPTPHGRLIDGDKLLDKMSNYTDNEGAKMPFGYDDTLIHRDSACFMIENAPTLVESEK